MANPVRGAQLWEEISVVLDDIIITTQQQIDINNKSIWNPYLHAWTNEDWQDMLSIIDHAIRTNPDIATDYNRTAILNAQAALNPAQPRSLDKKDTKKYAWAAIMSMREMYNKLNGWTIKNAPGQSWPQTSTTNFDKNFE